MKRRALGKGLEAIISGTSQDSEDKIIKVRISEVYPNPYQQRKVFDKVKLEELAESIKKSGLIQPIVVYKKDGKYFILAGERRWRASQILKWEKIPVIVKSLNDEEILIQSLVENIQREDLNAIEVAEGIKTLIDYSNLKHEEVSKYLGISRSAVTNYLRLLSLNEKIKSSIIKGIISYGHARALLSLKDDDFINKAYNIVVKKSLNVRETEKLVKNIEKQEKQSEKSEKKIDPDLKKAEEELIKLVSSKVMLKYNKKGQGKIEIYFNNLDEYNRIYEILKKGVK